MTATDLARRVVEAKAKGEALPWANDRTITARHLESLVVQLCEVTVAMGLNEEERKSLDWLRTQLIDRRESAGWTNQAAKAITVLDKLRGAR